MITSATLLEQLKSTNHYAQQVRVFEAKQEIESALPFGFAELDDMLPAHGVLRGCVVELSVKGRAALGTSLALLACRSAQQEGLSFTGNMPWCAFIDPTSSLNAPGVLGLGGSLERLLLGRPPAEAVARTAIRLVESHAFSLTRVDTVGVPGALILPQNLAFSPVSWPRTVRRLTLALEGTRRSVLLITDAAIPRAMPWPVAERPELSRPQKNAIVVRVAKDKRGRVSSAHQLVWPPTPIASCPQRLALTRMTCENPPRPLSTHSVFHARLSA